MRLPVRLLDVAVIGLVFPVASVLGLTAGRWVGSWLGAPAAGAMIGLLFGIAAGFYNAWQTIRRVLADEESGGFDDP